jgi:predicted GNAT family acetyltransferase
MKDDFISADSTGVRWLDMEKDYILARDYWAAIGQELKNSTWMKAYEFGYEYAAVIEFERIVSIAAVWRFSDKVWELAAVNTLPSRRQRGYSKRVVSFVTSSILQADRLATCSTDDRNIAMIATAKSVGFKVVPFDQVWWKQPDLPDF